MEKQCVYMPTVQCAWSAFIAVGGGEGDWFIVGSEKSRFYCYYCDCYLDLSLHHMLKMSTLGSNTGTKTLAPLLDCVIDNCLIKFAQFSDQYSVISTKNHDLRSSDWQFVNQSVNFYSSCVYSEFTQVLVTQFTA